MSYSDLLKNPKWQKKRLEILSRDEFTCRTCGNVNETLHVHHSKYIRNKNPWEYKDLFLITLCETCHNKIHGNKKITSKNPLLLVNLLEVDEL